MSDDESLPTPEDLKLMATFADLRKNQITFLNEAGKRVIELSTGMLGVLFAVMAFGNNFPPPYLKNGTAQFLAVLTLALFFLALLAGFVCVQPQEYKDYPHNLTAMREELVQHNQWKAFWFRAGSILFGLGAFCLACLIASIIV